ncbi:MULTISPECIES: hypothetical protein [Providencia]|uniref:hypothetical protein n=1 Tax=Providencia TaxID=586 RepID=UPI0005B54408|nr:MULTISPECIES: hypothetical protein [Providencia]APC10536.1 hypothetical protein RB151_008310 [Providencia rettgeri]AVL74150.1 hypothetical protein CEQ08_10570 [Providencia rettgeri]EJD6043364.1 hypothetical protein [Providencia rettgeri]EKH6499192.1 hypothetical protein [Providencia rettgeri]ELR5055294.1 hypothetical protein [Providencia rettgeri]
MSIGITCFTTSSIKELQDKLDLFYKKYSDVFPKRYYLSKAALPDEIDIEIANEFGLTPRSYFYMSVNDKTLVISTDDIAELVKKELGKENVVVLLNGEDLI